MNVDLRDPTHHITGFAEVPPGPPENAREVHRRTSECLICLSQSVADSHLINTPATDTCDQNYTENI
jgi:hypothetical protein